MTETPEEKPEPIPAKLRHLYTFEIQMHEFDDGTVKMRARGHGSPLDAVAQMCGFMMHNIAKASGDPYMQAIWKLCLEAKKVAAQDGTITTKQNGKSIIPATEEDFRRLKEGGSPS